MQNGRWGFVLTSWLLSQLGYAGMDVVPSALILSTALLIGAGFVYARVLFGEPGAFDVFVFISLFALHPFNTEFFTFSDVTLTITLAIFLASVGLACTNATARPWTGLAAGGFLLVLATSIYQLALVDAVVVGLLSLIGRTPTIKPTQTRRRTLLRYASLPQARGLFVLIAAAMAYLACTLAVRRIFGLALSERLGNALSFGGGERVKILIASLRLVLKPPAGLVTDLASSILIGLLLAAALAIVLDLLNRGIIHAILGVLILLASGIVAVSLCAAEQSMYLTPRELSPFSIWAAGVIALGWHSTRLATVRYCLGFALALLLWSFVGSSNRILYDQWRSNLWDRQQANRILMRLEDNPGFRDIHALVLVNGNWRFGSELSTTIGDMNGSAFGTEWAKLPMMEQTTGFRFGEPSAKEAESAKEYCKAAGVWPSPDSAVIRDGVAIVCLPQPD